MQLRLLRLTLKVSHACGWRVKGIRLIPFFAQTYQKRVGTAGRSVLTIQTSEVVIRLKEKWYQQHPVYGEEEPA